MGEDIHNQVYEFLEKDTWEWVGRVVLFIHFIFCLCFIPWRVPLEKKWIFLTILCGLVAVGIAVPDVFYKGRGFLKGIIRGWGLTEIDEQSRPAIKVIMCLYILSVLLITFVFFKDEDLRCWSLLWVWWVLFLTYFMFWIQSNGTGYYGWDIAYVLFTIIYLIISVVSGVIKWDFIKSLQTEKTSAEKDAEETEKAVKKVLSPGDGGQNGGRRRRR